MIAYRTGNDLDLDAVIDVYVDSTLGARRPVSDRSRMPSEKSVGAVLDRQVEAWNRGDLEAFMATYWNSPALVFQSGATRTKGWQATRERYRRRYQGEGKEMGRLRFDELEILVVGPDAAFVRGRWPLAMMDGTKPNGLFTLLLRRIGDAWKIVHDHTS
jgi:beta-aspartyl-peptidase (threonine type)